MPPFPKPTFAYDYDVDTQLTRLRAHRAARGVPAKGAGRILILTWNVANLGQQERTGEDLVLIAEVMSWFDVVAVQECKENVGHLFDVLDELGPRYKALCSDASGNNERLAFLFDAKKLHALEEVGEIAFPVAGPGFARACWRSAIVFALSSRTICAWRNVCPSFTSRKVVIPAGISFGPSKAKSLAVTVTTLGVAAAVLAPAAAAAESARPADDAFWSLGEQADRAAAAARRIGRERVCMVLVRRVS